MTPYLWGSCLSFVSPEASAVPSPGTRGMLTPNAAWPRRDPSHHSWIREPPAAFPLCPKSRPPEPSSSAAPAETWSPRGTPGPHPVHRCPCLHTAPPGGGEHDPGWLQPPGCQGEPRGRLCTGDPGPLAVGAGLSHLQPQLWSLGTRPGLTSALSQARVGPRRAEVRPPPFPGSAFDTLHLFFHLQLGVQNDPGSSGSWGRAEKVSGRGFLTCAACMKPAPWAVHHPALSCP